MVDFEYNRIATQSDMMAQTNEVRDERRDVPMADVLAETLYCLKFNEEWKPHIIGAVSTLQRWTNWIGADDDTNTGSRQITKLLAQDMTDCASGGGGDCTIEELLADDEFFQDEYIPQVFGDYVSEQSAHESELTTAYDGTPQSIGADIPVAAPNATQQNALCYAINKFVRLYCSQKICTIQAKNFLQVAWNELQNAMNEVYNLIENFMVIYTPNLFSCFVDDVEALTVLPDEAAQEDLACFLFSELEGVAMSQTAFDDAMLDAATSLSGNEQKIACVMNQDNSTLLYLFFLESYNLSLQKQYTGDDVECPCTSDTYKLWAWNFATQGQGDSQLDGISGLLTNFVPGTGWVGQVTGANTGLGVNIPLDTSWKIRGIAYTISFPVNINNRTITVRPTANYAATQVTITVSTTGTGTFNVFRATNFTPTLTGNEQTSIRLVSPSTSPAVVLSAIAILYEYDFAPLNAIPSPDINFATYVHDW